VLQQQQQQEQQLSMKTLTKHKMKEQYKIKEMLFSWLRSIQDIAMLSEHVVKPATLWNTGY